MAPDGSRADVLVYLESTSSGQMPRVYVFDTTASAGQQPTLPVISPDGKTLFFAGDKNLIVTSTTINEGFVPTSVVSEVKPRKGVRTQIFNKGLVPAMN
ncbi:hypothetical protein GCM10027046_11900 [Uliginosibacterium flavum]|uniref:WD40-like Beta Propeller Repeat n=1 Tax=Uliginosibacterium flavum TaxID=1396831 RepID=A0ABV2TQE9_9RHOO